MRSVSQDMALDEAFASVSPHARLLKLLLPTMADRDGRLEDRPRSIRALIFPHEPEVDADALLAELDRVGIIQRYEATGEDGTPVRCIAFTRWKREQRPHPKETSFHLPAPSSREVSRLGADASRRVPLGVDLGVVVGSGCGNGSSASQEPAAVAPVPLAQDAAETATRPPLVLSEQPAGKPPRKPSTAEVLYAKLEKHRRAECERADVAFVPESWSPQRVNTQLGPYAKGEPAAQAGFEAAWEAYLDEPTNAAKDPPWSIGYFLASFSTWASRAAREERAAGGAP
jgi:hypothetical protein